MLIKNEKVLIDILSTRTYQQRQKIMKIFNKTYNKDIIQELQKYFSGKSSFDEFINSLFTNKIEYDCLSLRNANKGINPILNDNRNNCFQAFIYTKANGPKISRNIKRQRTY